MLFLSLIPRGCLPSCRMPHRWTNKGIELQLSFDILKERAFKWTLDFNLTHYKNKLTKLTQDEVWKGTKKWVEGGSIYDFWLMKWAGVDAENGDELWWYKNGDAWEKTNDYSLAVQRSEE